MFYYEIPWFYQDFKKQNMCFLNLYAVHPVRMLSLSLEVMLIVPKCGTKHLYKGFSFMPEQVKYFYFLQAKFINVFKDVLPGCNF